MSNKELIAEARAEVERAAHGTPGTHAALIRAGEVDDIRLRLLVRLADALAAVSDTTPSEPVADEAVLKLRGLGAPDGRIHERLNQAAMLEATGVTADDVNAVCKVAATGRVTTEDILMLGKGRDVQVSGVTTPSDRAMQIAQAIAKAHTFSTPTALSIADAALKLAAAPTPSELSPLLSDGFPGHDKGGSDRAEWEAEEEPVESSASLLLGETCVDEREGEPEERGGDVVVHASTLPATPSEGEREALARDVIDRMFGWKHLRKYGQMSQEWMDKLRDGLARAIVHSIPLAPSAHVDREKLAENARAEIITRLGLEAEREDGPRRITAFVAGAEWAAACAVSPAPARDEWEIEYAGDHGDGSYCLVDSADETRACGTGVYRHVTAWQPLPVAEEERA